MEERITKKVLRQKNKIKKMEERIMKKMLLTVACLFAANQASAAGLQNITMDFYDASNVPTGYTTTVTGTLDTSVASGHIVGDVPFFGLIWSADEMWVSATAGNNTWAGAALTTSYGAQTNFNYTFTLAPGDIAMGLYFDWSVNSNIPVLAVFHPEGDGSMSPVDQVWFKGTTTTPRMGMQTAPFPGQFPKFSGELANPCAGVTCDQGGPCETGACVDGSCIYTYQCNDLTQDCVNNACVPKDPCAGVTCDNPGPCQVGQCVGGACVYNSTCAAEQVCLNNVCVAIDSCAGVVCDQAQPCETGACVNGACVYTTTCAATEECVNGECVTADNCLGVECPPPTEPCHASACLEGLCISIPTCTANQQCLNNQCVDIDLCAGVVCDQAGPCQTGACVEGNCVYTSQCNEATQNCVENQCVAKDLCDANGDGAVDIADIQIIGAARNTVNPALDIDGDGIVTVLDSRKCVLECDMPRCAQTPAL